jgi:hypothetical protein
VYVYSCVCVGGVVWWEWGRRGNRYNELFGRLGLRESRSSDPWNLEMPRCRFVAL